MRPTTNRRIRLMENDLRTRNYNPAYHIWQSAGNEVSRALDFWLMAERMVIELAADSARLGEYHRDLGLGSNDQLALGLAQPYFYRIRSLARQMWLASNERQERSLLTTGLPPRNTCDSSCIPRCAPPGATIGREEALAIDLRGIFAGGLPGSKSVRRPTSFGRRRDASTARRSTPGWRRTKTLESAGTKPATTANQQCQSPITSQPGPQQSRDDCPVRAEIERIQTEPILASSGHCRKTCCSSPCLRRCSCWSWRATPALRVGLIFASKYPGSGTDPGSPPMLADPMRLPASPCCAARNCWPTKIAEGGIHSHPRSQPFDDRRNTEQAEKVAERIGTNRISSP